jgi:hypothetical protein
MNRIFCLSAAMSLVMGGAAYAGAQQPVPYAPPTSAPPTALALNSQGTIVSTVPIFNAANPNVPGATGRTIIRGNNSTIAGDAAATRMQRTGTVGGD